MTAKRIIRNPSGYHSKGRTHKEKIINFALFLKEQTWTGKWHEDPDSEILHLNATCGDAERIDIEWPKDQSWPDVWYTYAGNTIKCRNISEAAKRAQETPDPERMRLVARRRRKATRNRIGSGPASPVDGRTGAGVGSEVPGDDIAAELATTLPFDRESSPEEIKQVLVKKSVTWVNKKTGNVNTATIKPKNFRVNTNKEGRIIVNFADEFGFHAVYIDSIIGVG